MKKIILILFSCLLFVGCGNKSNDVLKSLEKKINKTKSYHLTGVLKINRGENEYVYNVSTSYQNNDYYRVSLTNTINNHEQIILRNDDGVFVLTPSLNKSFKFQSDWPYNNSQIYLLQIILSDIKNDDSRELIKDKDGYIFKTKVNYTSNSDLKYQKVYIDDDYNIKCVEVYDASDNLEMSMTFSNIDYKTSYDNEYFALENNTDIEKLENTSKEINNVVYPMYVPLNTYLTNQETIETVNGERVILTFEGESTFMLVEETINVSDNLETYMVNGEPDIILDTIGSVTDYSVSWISNGVEYYLVSNDMEQEEMINVASSISSMPVGK